jgi:hypothetical protein
VVDFVLRRWVTLPGRCPRRGVFIAVVVLCLGAVGCTTHLGALHIAGTAEAGWPVMRLTPGAQGRACAVDGLFGLVSGGGTAAGLLERAIGNAVAATPDGQVLSDVSIDLETVDTLLIRRRCVRVQGTVGRRVRSIVVH